MPEAEVAINPALRPAEFFLSDVIPDELERQRPRCASCPHWWFDETGDGEIHPPLSSAECRLAGPPDRDDDVYRGEWRRTMENEGCGEHPDFLDWWNKVRNIRDARRREAEAEARRAEEHRKTEEMRAVGRLVAVDSTQIATRYKKVLAANGVTTLGDLAKLEESVVVGWKGIGETAIWEIREAIGQYFLSLGSDAAEESP